MDGEDSAAPGARVLNPAEIISTVDVRQLDSQARFPIMRLLIPDFVDHLALEFYVRDLLKTHAWSLVRVVPHVEDRHVYDVFGVRAQPLPNAASMPK